MIYNVFSTPEQKQYWKRFYRIFWNMRPFWKAYIDKKRYALCFASLENEGKETFLAIIENSFIAKG